MGFNGSEVEAGLTFGLYILIGAVLAIGVLIGLVIGALILGVSYLIG